MFFSVAIWPDCSIRSLLRQRQRKSGELCCFYWSGHEPTTVFAFPSHLLFFSRPATACFYCSSFSPSPLSIFYRSGFDPPCLLLWDVCWRIEENQTVMEVKDGAREVNRPTALHVCDLCVKLILTWPNSLPSSIPTPLHPFMQNSILHPTVCWLMNCQLQLKYY